MIRIAAVSMVKDEADIVAQSVSHMLDQAEFVIIADNRSSDGTREILEEIAATDERLTVVDDPEPAYYQSQKMTALAQIAADNGAQWVVPFDADEIWSSAPAGGQISDALSTLPDRISIASADLYHYIPTALDSDDDDPLLRIGWREERKAPLPKVAFRADRLVFVHQGNHDAQVHSGYRADGVLQIRHYPYRNADQFVSKARNGAAAYALTNLPPSVGDHWRQYGKVLADEGEDACRKIFYDNFFSADPETDPDLIYDPFERNE